MVTLEQTPSVADGTGYAVFQNERRIAFGTLADAVTAAKAATTANPHTSLLIFDPSARRVELDLRGAVDDILARLRWEAKPDVPEAPRPGRPRLGVVAKEVTLLPRHWEWLSEQPGGASVALRKLVDEARRANAGNDRIRRSAESAYRFMSQIAGDLAGFEEASRSLFAHDRARFERMTAHWPTDIREHVAMLASDSFSDADEVNATDE